MSCEDRERVLRNGGRSWRSPIRPSGHPTSYARLMKRAFDVLVASIGLVVLAPVSIWAAVLIVREDGRPVLYGSVRVGRHGNLFRMWKLRTMVKHAERLGGPSTAGDDPRLLRSGMLLRRYKIDEIPQLVNVLRGEMSLVGPRPEVPHYVSMYTSEEREILNVRPGITDWASIRFRDEGEILRGAPDPELAYMELIRPEKIRLGREYARHHSLLEDVRIIIQTVRAVFAGR